MLDVPPSFPAEPRRDLGLLESFASGGVLSDADGEFYVLALIPDVAIQLQAQLGDDFSNTLTITVPPGMERQNLVLSSP